MQTKCDASRDFSFLMLMLLDENANAIFIYDADVPCSLFMMMLVHAFKLWCKCLLTEMEMWMSSNGYVMMQMSFYKNAMTWMSSCRYEMNANVPLWVYHDMNTLVQAQFIQKFSFIFKRRLPQCLKSKYSQNLIYYSWKVIFLLT